jgi:RNA polymerase sigma-70 factor (ECF subfamily)
MAERADDDRITAWAIAAGRGDRAALTAFVRATQRDVHRFVAHLSGQKDADDLAQETYLRALRALPDFAGRSSARTWLLSIARYTAADAVRAASRRPRLTMIEDPTAEGPGAAHSAVDEAVLLRTLVTELDADRREAFVLTQVLDLSYVEAAEVCGCPVGTIRSRVARAREDLIAAMEVRPPTRSRRADGA